MHASGNAEGAEPGAADMERRAQRGEIRRKAGERKPEKEKMPKKESSGGKESETKREAASVGKVARAQEIAICGSTRNQRGYQSKYSRPSARPHGKFLTPPFTSLHERSLVSLPQLVATNQRVG